MESFGLAVIDQGVLLSLFLMRNDVDAPWRCESQERERERGGEVPELALKASREGWIDVWQHEEASVRDPVCLRMADTPLQSTKSSVL